MKTPDTAKDHRLSISDTYPPWECFANELHIVITNASQPSTWQTAIFHHWRTSLYSTTSSTYSPQFQAILNWGHYGNITCRLIRHWVYLHCQLRWRKPKLKLSILSHCSLYIMLIILMDQLVQQLHHSNWDYTKELSNSLILLCNRSSRKLEQKASSSIINKT